MTRRSYAHVFDDLELDGRIAVTSDELVERLDADHRSVAVAIHRASQRGEVRSPMRGFHVVVPLRYRERQDVPIDWFLDDWMRFARCAYRVSGLAAAARHGATHQAARSYDVVIDRTLRRAAGRWPERVRFHRDSVTRPTREVETPYAPLRLATPEVCAFDLVTWPQRFGGLSHVATVLSELELDEAVLAAEAHARSVSVVRRLGFVLERVGAPIGLAGLYEIASRYATPTPLVGAARTGPVDPRWGIIENASVEVDET